MNSDSYTYSSDNDTTEEYVDLIGFDDYEILNVYPFNIRRKDNKHVMKEYINKTGYYRINLRTPDGCVSRFKHILIAQQFISNPNNLPKIEHINSIKTDNHLENLRWIERRVNNRNKTVKSYGKRIYLDHAPDDVVEILSFNDVQYNSNTYYFCYNDDCVYKRYDDDKWQKLKQSLCTGYLRITMFDTNGRQHTVYMHTLIKHFRTETD